MLSRAESESAGGRGSSCCYKLCSSPSAHILPCDASWLCSGRDHTATAPLSAAQATPLHPCILLETLRAQRASVPGRIRLGLSFLGLDFPFGTQAWGKFVPSWIVAVWDTLQAAPALGLSTAEGLSVSLGVKRGGGIIPATAFRRAFIPEDAGAATAPG